MRKALFISVKLTIMLLLIFLAIFLDVQTSADETIKEALRQGNKYFEASDYTEALMAYEAGLSANAESEPLNYNAAQTVYLLGDYEKTIEYFDKSGDTPTKFLAAGNICYRAGESVQDVNQKMQLYTQAIQYYGEGIIKYPQEVPIKYNYEFVKKLLDELSEATEQESSDQSEDGENQDNKEISDNSENEEIGDNSENGQEEESESTSGDKEQDSESSDESQGEQEDTYLQEEGESEPDQEAVERILQMLENQEEQSLKNNQEVVGGKEDKNGW